MEFQTNIFKPPNACRNLLDGDVDQWRNIADLTLGEETWEI
jgi:hypothetical protein